MFLLCDIRDAEVFRWKSTVWSLFRVTLERIPRGRCRSHLPSELRAESSSSSDIPNWSGGRGVFPGEFMGFSGWFFNGSPVCLLSGLG